jgi:hypothetical protein
MGKNVTRVKVSACLLCLALVSAMVAFYKYVLLALIYAVALVSTDEFDRNALLDAVAEAQEVPGCSAITRAQKVPPARDPGSFPRQAQNGPHRLKALHPRPKGALQVRLPPSSSRFFPKEPSISWTKSLSKPVRAGIHRRARIMPADVKRPFDAASWRKPGAVGARSAGKERAG